MSTKDLKALGRRFINEFNKGEAAALAVMDEFYAPNVVVHSGNGEEVCGLKDYKQSTSELFNAFPDVHWTIARALLVMRPHSAILLYSCSSEASAFLGVLVS